MKKSSRKPYYRDEEFLRGIGERIRKCRINAGLTQMDLAFRCNDIDYSQINRLELGKVNFSISYIKLIATALEVKTSDLLPNN